QLSKQYRRFSRIIEQKGPELVLGPLSQTVGGLLKDLRFLRLAQKAGIRTLAHLHGGELDRTIERSPKPFRAYIERCIRGTEGTIVLADRFRPIFRPYLPEERIFTVPNGIPIEHDGNERRSPPPFRILFLSNPLRRKGVEDVIVASEQLREQGYEIQLDVAGEWFEPSFQKACMDKVDRNELPVRFHPPLEPPAKKELLESAHLFLLPPRGPEGLPLALIEALGHGLPIISTDRGAIPETVEEGWNGHLIPEREPSAIAERVSELIEDPERREAFGKRSRERYESSFTEERLSENLYHCWDSLLKLPSRG
ncbi:MAG: glycosyltransferase family 4 protein, partial [Flavobacteriales bacterium]